MRSHISIFGSGGDYLPSAGGNIAVVGTPQNVSDAGQLDAANPAAFNVTVETGCNAVLFTWVYWATGEGHGLTTVTLGGASPDVVSDLGTGSSEEPATGFAVWWNPTTGTRSLDVAWDATPATLDVPIAFITCIEGAATTLRDHDFAHGSYANAVSVTLTTVADDLVIKFDRRFDATTHPSNTSGWTSLGLAGNESSHGRLASIVATGVTQACPSEDEYFSCIVAVAFAPA